ncbi:protein of unknown function [Tenacibaculum aestuariivivum]
MSNSNSLNYQFILNYFDNRKANALAEFFKLNVKVFRTQLQFRGAINIEFLLIKLMKNICRITTFSHNLNIFLNKKT